VQPTLSALSEHLASGRGDKYRVFERADRPPSSVTAVQSSSRLRTCQTPALSWLDGESHAWLESYASSPLANVAHRDPRETCGNSVAGRTGEPQNSPVLPRTPECARYHHARSRLTCCIASPRQRARHLGHVDCLRRRRAHVERGGSITVKTPILLGYVHVDDIAVAQNTGPGIPCTRPH